MAGPNRAQRRAMAAAARKSNRSSKEVPPPPQKSATPRKGQIMTFEWEKMTLAMKCTDVVHDWTNGTVNPQFVPLEDSIHPVPLTFPAPLTEYSTDDGRAITHHWEKLTYVFGLPDPSDFPVLPVSPDDRQLMEYFVQTCRDLAGYSVINGDDALLITAVNGEWEVKAKLPTKESFGGTAVAFRQLHSGKEEASFDKIKGRLFQLIKSLPEDKQIQAHTVLTQWARARAELMNSTLSTLVCRKATGATADKPVSFREVNPEELIATYNYGGTIHFGKNRQAFVDLTKDPSLAAYYSYACLTSIAGLSHLYFGFAALLEFALGAGSGARVTTADDLSA